VVFALTVIGQAAVTDSNGVRLLFGARAGPGLRAMTAHRAGPRQSRWGSPLTWPDAACWLFTWGLVEVVRGEERGRGFGGAACPP
jgi:hypothetical protein